MKPALFRLKSSWLEVLRFALSDLNSQAAAHQGQAAFKLENMQRELEPCTIQIAD